MRHTLPRRRTAGGCRQSAVVIKQIVTVFHAVVFRDQRRAKSSDSRSVVITCVPHGMLVSPVPAPLYPPGTHSRRQSLLRRHLTCGCTHYGGRGVLDCVTAESSYTRPPFRRMASASQWRGLAGEYVHRCDPAAHQLAIAGDLAANGVGVQHLQLFLP